MVDSLDQYLSFVRDVLGVKKIMTSEDLQSLCPFKGEKGTLTESDLMKKYSVVFVNKTFTSKESLFDKKTWALFDKMKSAMKLGPLATLQVDTQTQSKEQILKDIHAFLKTDFVVLFTPEPKDLELESHYNFKLIECHTPYIMLSAPQYKKPAWESLQKVMAKLI